MKKRIALVAFVMLVFLTISGRAWLRAVQVAPVQQYREVPQEGKGCSAPKSWGEVKGVADRAIAFEDPSGTIRVLDVGPCMRGETQLIVKIVRP